MSDHAPGAPPPPESFLRHKEADQPFWKEQERSIQGALGQPCCTLSGISSGLIRLPGNFAVVVHGEDESGLLPAPRPADAVVLLHRPHGA